MRDAVDAALVNRVRSLVAELLSVPPADVGIDTRLQEDLGADSLALAELVYRLEEHFAIRLRVDDAERVHCVRAAAALVAERLAEAPPAVEEDRCPASL